MKKCLLLCLPMLIWCEWREIPSEEIKKYIQPTPFEKLTGRFKQVKSSALFTSPQVQGGEFTFEKKENRLMWKYTDPKNYGIFFSDSEKYYFDEKNKKIEMDTSMVPHYIEKLIIRGVRQEVFSEMRDFEARFFKKGVSFRLELKPLNRRMARMVKKIQFIFEGSTHPSKIRFIENNTDHLEIEFLEIKEE